MNEHKPFIDPKANIPELTLVPLLMGSILGIVFGASSLYLALKVGMTVSASIPVAVLSITLFRGLSKAFGVRSATILENNIVQTTGSAGESIAFGVAVTMPALLILGHDMELSRIMTVSILGGLLGVLMMIPLRRALIVKSNLTFPEGTACAEVLIVGEEGGTSAKTVFTGFFVGLIYKILNVGMKLWTDVPERAIGFFKGAAISCEVSPELMGVGYIIGIRNASFMMAGGIMSSWLLIPAIKLFGGMLTVPMFPATKLISEMSTHEIWKSYVLYIGAGAVATAGIMSMISNLPLIIRSASAGLKSFKSNGSAVASELRTDRDLSLTYVVVGSLLLIIAISLVPSLHMNILGAVLIVLFGFLFVTVSSRITGDVGSSSNPVSGMTVATLLMTSLIFLFLGWTSPMDRITALSIAAIVCVACSNGGTTAQDLKTGHLVGATPKLQQIALLIGVLTSALVIGYTLNVLNDASTIYSKQNLPTTTVPNIAELTTMENVKGVDAKNDANSYHVLRVTEMATEGPMANVMPGKYLINDNGSFAYLVDPGINGTLKTRDDGTSVPKYEAPKARLMSLIIDGILTQKLPWGLVLLGAAIAIMMQLCGVNALAFAVGVYLPFSSSAPIFCGGVIRWLVQKLGKNDASDDSSPGILYSSGLIAGGSIAGIALALLAVYEGLGSKMDLSKYFPDLAASNWTAVIMFTILMVALYRVASRKNGNGKT
jgi:putative OPT family oligopeptide transporter